MVTFPDMDKYKSFFFSNVMSYLGKVWYTLNFRKKKHPLIIISAKVCSKYFVQIRQRANFSFLYSFY